MLSKVDNSIITISLSSSYTPNSFIGGQYLSSNTLYWWYHGNSTTYPYDEARKATLFTASISGAYTFKIKAWQNSSNCKFWFGTYYDNILSEITPVTATSSDQQKTEEYTITINVNAGETIYIYPHIQGGQNAGLRIKLETYSITLSAQLFKNSNIVWLPKEIKNIGTLWISTIWGIHNKEFYAQASTTTVTTWEITPGNFVGYLNIWGYKIPYYL